MKNTHRTIKLSHEQIDLLMAASQSMLKLMFKLRADTTELGNIAASDALWQQYCKLDDLQSMIKAGEFDV